MLHIVVAAAIVPVAAAQDHSTHSAPTGAHADHGGDAGDASHPETALLIQRMRAATEPFRDRAAAARAGYRRVGIDFPAMGEHWVNPGLLIRRGFDYDRPAILTYTMIDGRPTLTGVVLTVALDPGESPPMVAGAERPWHEHNESIAEESLVRPAVDAPRTDRRRLAVLHLWTETPNPAGPFATENWALPFARLGFAPPASLPPDAGRALSLLSGGESYFTELVVAAGGAEASSTAQSILAEARSEVVQLVRDSPHAEPLSGPSLERLVTIWTAATRRIATACGGCTVQLSATEP